MAMPKQVHLDNWMSVKKSVKKQSRSYAIGWVSFGFFIFLDIGI
jgi:hypothetical protein